MIFDGFHCFFVRKANGPEAADSIFEISVLESILPRLVCLQISCALVLPEGGVQQFWWQFSIFKVTNNFNPELISKVLELPESHWTSPLGPLDGCCGLGFSKWCEALSSGGFFGKIRVKTCKVTDLHENLGILHFKVRRIRIYQRFCHSSRIGGVENRDF